jgi:predicted metalloendopeptidase
MTPAARRVALDKLSRMGTKIGYPSRWRRYDGLVIKRDDLVGNIQRAQQFENRFRMARVDQFGDRGEWLVTPQSVNAYYSPGLNEIVLPAAMLQPPLFQLDADDAVNYGGIGAVIGHEVGHALDEHGRGYDGDGGVRRWWQEQDEREFRGRAKRVAELYGAFSPAPGLRVDGNLTLSENIGDLAGLSVAYRAYRLSLDGRRSPTLDGFTGEQRVFLGWAQLWRGRIREEYLRQWLLSNPYAPPTYRTNGPPSHVQGFYDAFDVKPGDRLYLAPERRVRFW